MPNADIIVLPGVERRDIVGVELDSRTILDNAIGQGVIDVVIVGRRRNGELYVASATNDVDRAAGLLMRGVSFLSSATCNQGTSGGDPNQPQETA
jgi:hypothetical protein